MTDEGLRQEMHQPEGGGSTVAEGPPAESAFGLPIAVGVEDAMRIAQRRDRLLAALTLTAGVGLILATPFAL